MRIEKAYITTEIEHWNDIFRLNQRFMSNFVFRGQGNTEWGLLSYFRSYNQELFPYS